ncbi:hypothetical protein [Algisphaera agarilytica]|uniref:Uncharacterized protein n=1 Tax=Algisphaera agarilytica TaxID=1385975 RepID=A0A7X0LL94_9BACT|nr:hypothetical protein [Algisphaera agarilytica]MBB6429753.1 hypothetical protein [Algisphaera agarilytica]
MPITINSPYSGRPVKIRDEDIGRAVRDEEDRIFYVVQRGSGEGYYAAPTRKGSEKDEQRYDAMQNKMDTVQEQVTAQHQAVHDATGRKRSPVMRRLVLIVVLAILAAGGYSIYFLSTGGTVSELLDKVRPAETPMTEPRP